MTSLDYFDEVTDSLARYLFPESTSFLDITTIKTFGDEVCARLKCSSLEKPTEIIGIEFSTVQNLDDTISSELYRIFKTANQLMKNVVLIGPFSSLVKNKLFSRYGGNSYFEVHQNVDEARRIYR